jgi:hypothetical protein
VETRVEVCVVWGVFFMARPPLHTLAQLVPVPWQLRVSSVPLPVPLCLLQVLPVNASAHRESELTKGSSAGSRAGGGQHTPNSSTPRDVGNVSPAAAARHGHTAAMGSGGGSSGGGGVRALHPLPPIPADRATAGSSLGTGGSTGNSSNGPHAAAGSSNSRLSMHSSSGKPSAPSSSDKPSGAGSVGASQLQLVQRLPSLTGGTPRLVHKVETWLVQVRGCVIGGCVGAVRGL